MEAGLLGSLRQKPVAGAPAVGQSMGSTENHDQLSILCYLTLPACTSGILYPNLPNVRGLQGSIHSVFAAFIMLGL